MLILVSPKLKMKILTLENRNEVSPGVVGLGKSLTSSKNL